MTQYSSYANLSNSQLNNLKSAINNKMKVFLNLIFQIRLVILMMDLNFHINYYELIDKLQMFLKHFKSFIK